VRFEPKQEEMDEDAEKRFKKFLDAVAKGARMSQQVMIEELTKEIYLAIEKFNEALPLASVVGVFEVIKYELILNIRR